MIIGQIDGDFFFYGKMILLSLDFEDFAAILLFFSYLFFIVNFHLMILTVNFKN